MILKVCGITNAEDAAAALAAGATAIGFNFYRRSPRYIAPEAAAAIATPGARRVGVFVNESPARIAEIARIAALDTAQLHGDELPADYPAHLTIWKAIRVADGFALDPYTPLPVEALLLDGPAGSHASRDREGAVPDPSPDAPHQGRDSHRAVPDTPTPLYGGSGLTFDWGVAAHSTKHIIVAGGIDATNVARAIAVAHPWGVDACSRIESSPGKKDHHKMTLYLQAAKAALLA